MRPSVYIETTIPSYLTAWPSRDIIQAAQQQVTREWWARRDGFELFVSRSVVEECQDGDPRAAEERLAALQGITILTDTQEAIDLAGALLRGVPLPRRATTDALHIAVAAVQGIQYFLTWNCRHIANLTLLPRIESVCRGLGYSPPKIGTPQQLLDQGESDDRG